MNFGFDQAAIAGSFIGSGIAAFFAHSAHRQVRLPHRGTDDGNGGSTSTLGAAIEEVATSQRQLTGLVTEHIADDEQFQNQVRDVLQLRRATDRRRRR